MRSIQLSVRDKDTIRFNYAAHIKNTDPAPEKPLSVEHHLKRMKENYVKEHDRMWQEKLAGTDAYMLLFKHNYIPSESIQDVWVPSTHTGDLYHPKDLDTYLGTYVRSDKGKQAIAKIQAELEVYRALLEAYEAKYVEQYNILHSAKSTKQILDAFPDLIQHFPVGLVKKMNSPKPSKKITPTETFIL